MSNQFRSLLTSIALTIFTVITGCSSESTPSTPDASDTADASPQADAVVDAAPDVDAAVPTMLEGIAGETCVTACAALGKTCAAACPEHISCGGHDYVDPPYAGYACYFWENDDGDVRFNDGRSFTSCDEEVTPTWYQSGKVYALGRSSGGNPVRCCCQ